MNVEKEWLETLKILILYKFADKGTAESTADEIYRVFLNSQENKMQDKSNATGLFDINRASGSPDTHIKDYGHKDLIDKDYANKLNLQRLMALNGINPYVLEKSKVSGGKDE